MSPHCNTERDRHTIPWREAPARVQVWFVKVAYSSRRGTLYRDYARTSLRLVVCGAFIQKKLDESLLSLTKKASNKVCQ